MIKLSLQDIHLSYGQIPVLKGISLDLNEGDVMVLLGSSGSGKTTLLRSIAGLETPLRGTIGLHGSNVFDATAGTNLPPNKRNFGMVFQSYALWPHRSVFDNVAYGLKLRGVSKEDLRRRVQEVLDALGLSKLGDRLPHQLSGGQQQRVAIARALVYSPPVLLMDEPLSNLDAQLREEAKSWLKQVIKKLNLSAIIVTHDQSEALAIGDKVVLLVDGRVEQAATPFEIYNHPGSYRAARFFGLNNQFDGMVMSRVGSSVTIESGPLTLKGVARDDRLKPGDHCSAVIRVEECSLEQAPASDAVICHLVTSMYSGGHWEHLLGTSDGRTLRAMGRDAILPSSQYHLVMPPKALWVFGRT